MEANVSVPINGTAPLDAVLGAVGKLLHVTFVAKPSYQVLILGSFSANLGESLDIRVESAKVLITIGVRDIDISSLSLTSAMLNPLTHFSNK